MARVRLNETAEVAESHRWMFERMEANGDVLNIFRALSHSPEALRRFMKFGQYFLSEGKLEAGLRELAPHLIGLDPHELSVVNRRMDAALKGHSYVKSGIDIACWDLLGKAVGLPVCLLMGGRFGDSVRLYRAISQEAPDDMARSVANYRKQGYTRFQLKVGGDPDTDIERIRAVRRHRERAPRHDLERIAGANVLTALLDGRGVLLVAHVDDQVLGLRQRIQPPAPKVNLKILDL